jgi:hypothetical protein
MASPMPMAARIIAVEQRIFEMIWIVAINRSLVVLFAVVGYLKIG